jgi:thioredoxin reductase
MPLANSVSSVSSVSSSVVQSLPPLLAGFMRREHTISDYDSIIVGGGPAGLSTALMLGRCRRRVLVCDSGQYRNAAARAVWGYLTRDGTSPAELVRLGRSELERYGCVTLQEVEVQDVARLEHGFIITLPDGTQLTTRNVLLATGVVDELPAIEGVEAFYGASVHHCPYCDGWEQRDKPIAVYGRGHAAAAFTLEMTQWSRDLVLCTDGPASLDDVDRLRLARLGIPVREERIARLEGADGQLERVVFTSGDSLPRQVLFVSTPQHHRSAFARRLGCQFTPQGSVMTTEHEATCVPGLFVAGDASRREQSAIVAAAEGVLAAIAINTQLNAEDLALDIRA